MLFIDPNLHKRCTYKRVNSELSSIDQKQREDCTQIKICLRTSSTTDVRVLRQNATVQYADTKI